MTAENSTLSDRSVRTSVLAVFGGQLLVALVSFGIPIVLVRVLTQADFGIYKQFQLLYQTLMVFALFGGTDALVYFIARARGRILGFVLTCMLHVLTTLLAILVGMYFYGEPLVAFLTSETMVDYLPSILITLVGVVFGEVFLQALAAQKRFYLLAAFNTSFAAGQAIGVMLVGAATRDPRQVVLVVVVVSAVRLVVFAVWFFRLVARGTAGVKLAGRSEHLNYALPTGFSGVCKKLIDQVPRYLVTMSLGDAMYAVFAVGMTKVPMTRLLRGSIVRVIAPHFATLERDKRYDEIVRVWHGAVRRLSVLYMPISVGLIITAPLLIRVVFTDEYAGAVPVFQIFATGMMIESLGGIEAILKAFARTGFLLRVDLVRLFLSGFGGWFLLQEFGLVGPAIAVLGTMLIAVILRAGLVARLTGTPLAGLLPWGHLAKVLGSCALAAAGTIGAGRLLAETPLVAQIVASVATFATIYGVIVIGFRILPDTERDALFNALSRVLGSKRPAG